MYVGVLAILAFFTATPLACELGVWLFEGGRKD